MYNRGLVVAQKEWRGGGGVNIVIRHQAGVRTGSS